MSKLELRASTYANALSLMSPITKLILAEFEEKKERGRWGKISPHWSKKNKTKTNLDTCPNPHKKVQDRLHGCL